MATVISISNQKGGVGKTATTSALAYGLRQRGYRVLVVDADGQCNTTDAFRAEVEGRATLYDLMEKDADIGEAIQHTEYMDIVAGDYLLKQADRRFIDTGREYLIKEALEPAQDDYDFIIIDTIPGLGVMLLNALTASDYVIIPMGADRDSMQGLSQLSVVINQIVQYSNRELKILGFLITRAKPKVNLLKSFRAIMPKVEEQIKAETFKTCIRESIYVQEARAAFMPVIEYQHANRDKNVITVADYDGFIGEVLDKLGMDSTAMQRAN